MRTVYLLYSDEDVFYGVWESLEDARLIALDAFARHRHPASFRVQVAQALSAYAPIPARSQRIWIRRDGTEVTDVVPCYFTHYPEAPRLARLPALGSR